MYGYLQVAYHLHPPHPRLDDVDVRRDMEVYLECRHATAVGAYCEVDHGYCKMP